MPKSILNRLKWFNLDNLPNTLEELSVKYITYPDYLSFLFVIL